jgi:hypothetical protein
MWINIYIDIYIILTNTVKIKNILGGFIIMTSNEQMLQTAFENARAELLKEKITLPAERAGTIIASIVDAALEQLVLVAKGESASNGNEEVNLEVSPFITINIKNRNSDDGEKDSNRIVNFVPGPQARLAAKGDENENDED